MSWDRDIWSVSRLNSEIGAVLEASFPLLWIAGEVSNLSTPASGHLYFTLKDEAAQVRCVCYRHKRVLLSTRPVNGQHVVMRARVSLYRPRGEYQLLVETLEPAGTGLLHAQFEALRRRLAAEGLFDAARKRPLPFLPRQIGVLASLDGAALHDVLTVLRRRMPLVPVLIYPTPAQGQEAAARLVAALELASARADCEVLILARGGGSSEDLQPFNDETLVRALAAASVPTIVGVGHEIDQTLADLVADRRAPTPSAAAACATPDAAELQQRVRDWGARLSAAIQRRLAAARHRLSASARPLRAQHPLARLRQDAARLLWLEHRLRAAQQARFASWRAHLDQLRARQRAQVPPIMAARARHTHLTARLQQAQQRRLEQARQRLLQALVRLEAQSPVAILARGYALVTSAERSVVRRAAALTAGQRVQIRFADGTVVAQVCSTALLHHG